MTTISEARLGKWFDDFRAECGSADELLGRLRAGQSEGGNGSPEGRPSQA